MHEQGPVDFIEVIHNAVPSEVCAAIVERMRAARGLQPGAVGSGVFPELKHSKDLRISGLDGWQDVDHQLQHAVFNGLLTYLRRYPQALIAPLMLQIQDSKGQPRRLSAEDFPDMPQQQLADLARTCLRPGAINLQWYAAGEGGYPYWHCELYPKDAQAETLHRHVLWTLYLNDEFEEGETEFLFQGRKIAPRTGSLLIAPTAFTHTHRGNRPQGGTSSSRRVGSCSRARRSCLGEGEVIVLLPIGADIQASSLCRRWFTGPQESSSSRRPCPSPSRFLHRASPYCLLSSALPSAPGDPRRRPSICNGAAVCLSAVATASLRLV